MVKQICKNCKSLVKIKEEFLDKNIYFCLLDQSRTRLKWGECKTFEERTGELSRIPTIKLDFCVVYDKLLNTKTKELQAEINSHKKTVDKIRDTVGIKVTNIEKEASKKGEEYDGFWGNRLDRAYDELDGLEGSQILLKPYKKMKKRRNK